MMMRGEMLVDSTHRSTFIEKVTYSTSQIMILVVKVNETCLPLHI